MEPINKKAVECILWHLVVKAMEQNEANLRRLGIMRRRCYFM
jgi:hypothetical protein